MGLSWSLHCKAPRVGSQGHQRAGGESGFLRAEGGGVSEHLGESVGPA